MAKKAGGARKGEHRLTRDELLAALKTRQQEYNLDGVGTIIIEGVNADDFATATGGVADMTDIDAMKRICLIGVVDPVLTPDDLEALGQGKIGLIVDLSQAILRLSGMLQGDPDRFLQSTKG